MDVCCHATARAGARATEKRTVRRSDEADGFGGARGVMAPEVFEAVSARQYHHRLLCVGVDDARANLRRRNWRLYVIGWFRYSSQSGFVSETRFCREWQYPEGRFRPVGKLISIWTTTIPSQIFEQC